MPQFGHSSGKYLTIDDAEIYYEITGNEDKPVLLLLHGGFGTMEEFNAILPYLDREYKIIGIDSRGQGKSTLGSSQLTYRQIQNDVERVLEHLNIQTLSIIGFSDGGIVAYRLASQSSLNINKLVTIGADWNNRNLEFVKDIFLEITAESWRKKFPETYEAYQRLNPEPDFKRLTQSIVHMWLDNGESGYPNGSVKDISCPLLIVRGDDDHLVSARSLTELSELVEHSTLLNIPFAGHVVFNDQPEIFMMSLNKFLAH